MLYSILFAGLVYLSTAQKLTDYECSIDGECSTLVSIANSGIPGTDIVPSGQSIVCGVSMGYCTITCTDQTQCDTINGAGLGVTTSKCTLEDSVNKCIVDFSCTSSDECLDDIAPRCDTNIGKCVEDTSTPTVTVTKTPTVTPDPDATNEPTGSPTTPAEKRQACVAECTSDDNPYHCEAYEDYTVFELNIECEDVANRCEAYCLTDYKYTVEIAKVDAQYLSLIQSQMPDDLVDEFCYSGLCSDTPSPTVTKDGTESPTVTKDDGTSSPTTAAQNDCIEACESKDDDAMYCEGSETIDELGYTIEIPCTDVRNECEAECLVDAKKAELLTSVPVDYHSLVDSEIAKRYEDGLVATFCYSGTCEDPDEEPTTTDPCADPYWDNIDECEPETPDDSCGVQFNVTLDFCVLNRKFKMRQIWGFVKAAYALAIDTVSDYSGYCDAEADLSITRYVPGFKNEDARKKGKKKPTHKRDTDLAACNSYTADDWEIDDCCEAIDDICDEDRGNKQFSIKLDTEFNCGDCDTMRKIAVQVVEFLKEFDAKFILECLGFGVDGDTVCETGFGGMQMEVANAVLAYKDDDGDIEIIAEHSSEAGASEITYGFALMFAFIMAAIY